MIALRVALTMAMAAGSASAFVVPSSTGSRSTALFPAAQPDAFGQDDRSSSQVGRVLTAGSGYPGYHSPMNPNRQQQPVDGVDAQGHRMFRPMEPQQPRNQQPRSSNIPAGTGPGSNPMNQQGQASIPYAPQNGGYEPVAPQPHSPFANQQRDNMPPPERQAPPPQQQRAPPQQQRQAPPPQNRGPPPPRLQNGQFQDQASIPYAPQQLQNRGPPPPQQQYQGPYAPQQRQGPYAPQQQQTMPVGSDQDRYEPMANWHERPPQHASMNRGSTYNPQPSRPVEQFSGNGFDVEATRPTYVTGEGSRRTFETSHHDKSNVVLESDGRPVYADVQVWQGPNNTPASMKLYSEDGAMRPWNAGFQNTGSSTGSVMDVRNSGPMEFPITASVEGVMDGTKYEPIEAKEEKAESIKRVSQTIQGETLKTFSIAGANAVRVELYSEGRPMYATVELWQGPDNVQQAAEVYSDNGVDRNWAATIPTPGYGCTIAIRNTGPMCYPIEAIVEPMY